MPLKGKRYLYLLQVISWTYTENRQTSLYKNTENLIVFYNNFISIKPVSRFVFFPEPDNQPNHFLSGSNPDAVAKVMKTISREISWICVNICPFFLNHFNKLYQGILFKNIFNRSNNAPVFIII